MKRTFNYTGRKKINRADISGRLWADGDAWRFDVDLHLAEYRFPYNAEVWIEAHRQDILMQWPWGTISAIKKAVDTKLSEFGDPEGILFRVRVVHPDVNERHKLLGEAENIHFVKDSDPSSDAESLLPTRPDSLQGPLWKIEIDPAFGPVLYIERDVLPSWKQLAGRPEFQALVFPEVIKQVFTRILSDNSYDSEDDESSDDWQGKWLDSARILGVSALVPAETDDDSTKAEWVNDAVTVR